MSESNGFHHATNGQAAATKPPAKNGPASYLGDLCPVCHVPKAAHPLKTPDGKLWPCLIHCKDVPTNQPAIFADLDAQDAARENYRRRMAEAAEKAPGGPVAPSAAPDAPGAAPAFTPQSWAVLVRVPGDPSGEPADTGWRVVAATESEALMRAGTMCATGRVAVRPANTLDDWRRGVTP